MIHDLEGKTKPTVVLDAGISSEDNIEWLKSNSYTYIVVSKKNKPIIPDGASCTLQHKKDLSMQCRITSTMNCKDGKKLHIRKTSSPTPRQLEIYHALGISASPGKTEKSIF